jgi:hypothetical protein
MRILRLVAVLSAALVLVACPGKKKKGDDAGLALGEGGATAEPGAWVDKPLENENDITEYPQEQDVNEVAVILRDTAARKSPPNGAEIASLPASTTVKKLVRKDKAFRVAFDDPATGKRLCGWVGEEAFTPPAAASATATQTAWVAPKKDAGVAAGKDAGATTAADAGGGSAVAVADAGGAAPAKDAGAAVASKCPAGQREVQPGVCKKLCNTNGDCPGSRCTKKPPPEGFGEPPVCK